MQHIYITYIYNIYAKHIYKKYVKNIQEMWFIK